MVVFPVIFTPSAPVEHAGATYNHLNFTRPVGLVDVVRAEWCGDDIALKVAVINASLAGVPVDVVLALSVEDQIRLNDAVLPILELPPAVEV